MESITKEQINSFLDGKLDEISGLSDAIWDSAETAFEEEKSAALIIDMLKKHGFEVEENLADICTSFCATYGKGFPTIGILAEYDALFNLSQKSGVAKKEPLVEGGNGHGCGHNLFAGASVGAAIAVKEYLEKNDIQGTVKLFGCPGEEGGSGKAFMAREGAFNSADIAFGWHPASANAVMSVSSLANYQVLYKFKGISSHAAAAPELGRSALDAVELMNVGVNFLREHVIDEARIHYAITDAGGKSPNVVQPTGEVLYLIRAPKNPQVDAIYKRINKIAQGASLMTETELEIEFIKACSNVVNNTVLDKVMYENLKNLPKVEYTEEELEFAHEIEKTTPDSTAIGTMLGLSQMETIKVDQLLKDKDLCDFVLPFNPEAPNVVMSGSTDVGDVSWNIPTSQVLTTCFSKNTPFHSWQLVAQDRSSASHKGLLLAAKAIAGSAIDVINNPGLVEEAKAELKTRLAGDEYVSAIPKDVKPRKMSEI
ncbi:MAG: amidohydrolase [Clostridioides sp.]|jgi:aminobenzoyl-glutamate utilization protein B|nr:amidohydrolase [Clostridioides sp.]